MNHTPGPWEFDPIDRVIVKGGAEIAHMGRSANGADVRLIAAAPELLEALEAFDKAAKESTTIIGFAAKAFKLLTKTRAAIAKAKGEA
jgi:hypothetical protein